MEGSVDYLATMAHHSTGHDTELTKKFGFMSMLGISFVVVGTWTSAGSSMNLALPSGGPVAVLYGLVAAGVGSLLVAASLAELCSVFPTNGAQYEWTAVLAGPRYQKFLSYACGWVVTSSWWALAAAGPSLFSSLALALIQSLVDGYTFQKWHQFLIFIGVEIGAGIINAFGTALLPMIGKVSFILSLAGLFVISATVLAMTSGKHQSAKFVFTEFINQTGWNDGAAFLLGLLQGCYSLIAFDATAHLVEEMPNPQKDCPRTMVLSIILGTVTGFAFLVSVLFSVQDLDEVVGSSPLIVVFKQATGSRAATIALTAIVLTIIFCSAVEVVTSSSRMTAAFARQGGIPFSNFFAEVHKGLDLPLRSMLLTNSIVIILGLLYLGASTAFNAIISACVVGLGLSYLIPIAVLLVRGRHILPRSEFSLGRWGYAINISAALYLVFIEILFLFPSTPHPTASTMNYAIVILGGILCFAIGSIICSKYMSYLLRIDKMLSFATNPKKRQGQLKPKPIQPRKPRKPGDQNPRTTPAPSNSGESQSIQEARTPSFFTDVMEDPLFLVNLGELTASTFDLDECLNPTLNSPLSLFTDHSHLDVQLFQYYIQNLSTRLTNADGFWNPLRVLAVPRMCSSSVLFQAVCAGSAIHMARFSSYDVEHYDRVARLYYVQALSALKDLISVLEQQTASDSSYKELDGIILLTSIFLCKYEIIKGGMSVWRQHLAGVET
ncbi:hypothetical protein FSARC_13901, partial [Fusarium sarcochroum]